MSDITPHSDGYFIVDAQIMSHGGEKVEVGVPLFEDMARRSDDPLLKIGNGHYWPHPRRPVPADAVAVPEDIEFEAETPVLLAKAGAARDAIVMNEPPEFHM